jgi:hypothetical protein
MRATVHQIDGAVERTLTMAARHLRNLPTDENTMTRTGNGATPAKVADPDVHT